MIHRGRAAGMLPHRMRGVTLLELMVVVVIVGILAAVAYPSYRDSVDRAKRNEAKALLLEIAQNQERYYLQNNSYGTLAQLGYDNPQLTDSGAYAVTIGGADANNFAATATWQLGGRESDRCNTFTLDGRGSKSSAPYTDCWTRTR